MLISGETAPTEVAVPAVVTDVGSLASRLTWKSVGGYVLIAVLALRLALSIQGGVFYLLALLAFAGCIFIVDTSISDPARKRMNEYLCMGGTFAGVVFIIFGLISTFSGGPAVAVTAYSADILFHKPLDCEVLGALGRDQQYRTCMNLPN